MARTSSSSTSSARGSRLALVLGSLGAVVFGIVILAWPTKAAGAVAGIIAVYAIVAGVVYAVHGLISQRLGTGARVGHVVLGLLYIVAGILAFTELQASAAIIAVFVTVLVGVMWMLEGIVALIALGRSTRQPLAVVFAVVSIVAGITLVTSPLWAAVFLWWLLAIGLIVLGVLGLGRALSRTRD